MALLYCCMHGNASKWVHRWMGTFFRRARIAWRCKWQPLFLLPQRSSLRYLYIVRNAAFFLYYYARNLKRKVRTSALMLGLSYIEWDHYRWVTKSWRKDKNVSHAHSVSICMLPFSSFTCYTICGCSAIVTVGTMRQKCAELVVRTCLASDWTIAILADFSVNTNKAMPMARLVNIKNVEAHRYLATT